MNDYYGMLVCSGITIKFTVWLLSGCAHVYYLPLSSSLSFRVRDSWYYGTDGFGSVYRVADKKWQYRVILTRVVFLSVCYH